MALRLERQSQRIELGGKYMDRDDSGIPDWQEDENYADEAPLRGYPARRYRRRAGLGSWFLTFALALIIVIVIALAIYFGSR